MRTNSNIWIKKNLKVRRGPCGWLVLSEFLTVIITHSQAQLSTWESSIQNPAKPAVLFFSFFASAVTWSGLSEMCSHLPHYTGDFMVLYTALLHSENVHIYFLNHTSVFHFDPFSLRFQ